MTVPFEIARTVTAPDVVIEPVTTCVGGSLLHPATAHAANNHVLIERFIGPPVDSRIGVITGRDGSLGRNGRPDGWVSIGSARVTRTLRRFRRFCATRSRVVT
jgi:hypothetical protein